MAQSILMEQTKESGPSSLINPFTVELEANNISSTTIFQNCPEELETGKMPRINIKKRRFMRREKGER